MMIKQLLGVDPTLSYEENKKTISRFHRFGYENQLKLYVLFNLSQLSVIFG